jgi:glycosyltransferase involved in cell wall biosynthesis
MRAGILAPFPTGNTRCSGIAYYVRTVIAPLQDGPDEITVFADREPRSASTSPGVERLGRSIRILRCWRFGVLSPFFIAREIARHDLDVLHVEYDVYLYGGVVVALLLPCMLAILRRLRRLQIVTTLHGVVPQKAVGRAMLRENGFVLPFSHIGRLGFRLVYGLFAMASDRLIVLEQALARILHDDYGVAREKVFVVPIPLMHDGPPRNRMEAVAQTGITGDTCVLFVGYASYYKGLDILLDAFALVREQDPSIQLNIVAGKHPRLAGDPRYEQYYRRLADKALRVQAVWHGFEPEDRLRNLLACSAVVVFPYTAAYGASAALNVALAARRPVLVSSVMYFEGALPGQVFDPTARSCAEAILRFFRTLRPALEGKVEDFVRQRGVERVARRLHDVRCGVVADRLPHLSPLEPAGATSADVQPG